MAAATKPCMITDMSRNGFAMALSYPFFAGAAGLSGALAGVDPLKAGVNLAGLEFSSSKLPGRVNVDYPAPKDPGKLPPRANGGEATLHVCKKKRCFHSIQEAVNASRGGDTIKVANGTYKEGVQIRNRGRSGLH